MLNAKLVSHGKECEPVFYYEKGVTSADVTRRPFTKIWLKIRLSAISSITQQYHVAKICYLATVSDRLVWIQEHVILPAQRNTISKKVRFTREGPQNVQY